MLEKFKEMSLTRKVTVGLLFLSSLGLLGNAEFFGALVTGAIACFLILKFGNQDTERAYVEECIAKFEEMSLTRKLVVGVFALFSLAMLADGGFFGALIIGAIAYFLTITSGEQAIENNQPQNEDSDDDYLRRQQQYDDDYWKQKEEEDRLAALNQQNLDESVRGWH